MIGIRTLEQLEACLENYESREEIRNNSEMRRVVDEIVTGFSKLEEVTWPSGLEVNYEKWSDAMDGIST